MPDLPLDVSPTMVTPSSGQYLQRFGQQLQDFGNTLAASGDALHVLYQGQVTAEVTAAKRLAKIRMNEFNYAIESGQNQDYQSYMKAWEAYQSSTLQDAVSRMTLRPAKDEFTEFWEGEVRQNAAWVNAQAMKGLVAEVEAQIKMGMNDAARMGDVEGVLDYARAGSRGGLAKSEVLKMVGEKLPAAHYNYALNLLQTIGDPDTALSMLEDPGFDEQYRIPVDGEMSVASLRRYFEADGASRRERGQRQLVANAQKAFEAALPKWDNGTITLDEMAVLVGQTNGTTYGTAVAGMAAKLNDLYGRGADVIKEREQTAEAYSLQNSLYAWRRTGGQGEPPWNPDVLLAKYKNTTISEAQMKTLTEAWQKADEPDAVVGFRSRIYGAMQQDGEGKSTNPALAVMPSMIDDAYAKGELTIEQHKSLLGELDQARKDYEAGMNHTKADVEYEAASVVFSKTLTRSQREQWVRDHRADFSGDDFAKWLGRIEFSAGSDWRDGIFGALDDYYQNALRKEDISDAERKRLTLESYDAKLAMEAYMVVHPDDVPGTEAKLHEFKGNAAIKTIEKEIVARGLNMVPFTPLRPDTETARKLALAREAGLFQEFPAAAAGFESKYRPIEIEEEKVALRKAGIAWGTERRNALGDQEYVTASGQRYVVLGYKAPEDKYYTETIYTVTDTTTANGKAALKYDRVR